MLSRKTMVKIDESNTYVLICSRLIWLAMSSASVNETYLNTTQQRKKLNVQKPEVAARKLSTRDANGAAKT